MCYLVPNLLKNKITCAQSDSPTFLIILIRLLIFKNLHCLFHNNLFYTKKYPSQGRQDATSHALRKSPYR